MEENENRKFDHINVGSRGARRLPGLSTVEQVERLRTQLAQGNQPAQFEAEHERPASSAREVRAARVVSLVPSVTETLVAWGSPPIACTRFCEQPDIPHVGGTKVPDVAAIVALAPDSS